jgi:hypothetical protein
MIGNKLKFEQMGLSIGKYLKVRLILLGAGFILLLLSLTVMMQDLQQFEITMFSGIILMILGILGILISVIITLARA